MNESEEKAAFAKAMLSTNLNPLEAGQLVHPANFNRAAQIASMWHNDVEVKQLIAEIKKAELAESGISENEKYAEEKLKEIVENSTFPKDRIDALGKLIDIWGLSKKPQTSQQTVNVIMPRAIEVPTHGSDDEWETAAATQQDGLLNVSRSRH